jgi:hypothetical protein
MKTKIDRYRYRKYLDLDSESGSSIRQIGIQRIQLQKPFGTEN